MNTSHKNWFMQIRTKLCGKLSSDMKIKKYTVSQQNLFFFLVSPALFVFVFFKKKFLPERLLDGGAGL